MANKIQLRRDTAANWARVNPILDDGEPGLDIDSNQIKYGDGDTAWVDLPYAGGSSSGWQLTTSTGATVSLHSGTSFSNILEASTGTVLVIDSEDGGGLLLGSLPQGYGVINTSSLIESFDPLLIVSFGGTAVAAFDESPNLSVITLGYNEFSVLSPSGDTGTVQIHVLNTVTTSTWSFGIDGVTTFPNNKLKTTANNSLTIETTGESNANAMVFDGTSDSLVTFDGVAMGGGDFTIEFFFRLDADPASTQFGFLGATGIDGLSIYTGDGIGSPANDVISVDRFVSGHTPYAVSTLTNDGSWHHLAIVRDSGAGGMALWLDGVQAGSYNSTANYSGVTSEIGGWSFANFYQHGAMADLRITTDRVYSIFTSTIDVPTVVYENTTNTQLLLQMRALELYDDRSDNNYTLTPGVSTTYENSVTPLPVSGETLTYVDNHDWTFNTDGSITFPDGAVQSSTHNNALPLDGTMGLTKNTIQITVGNSGSVSVSVSTGSIVANWAGTAIISNMITAFSGQWIGVAQTPINLIDGGMAVPGDRYEITLQDNSNANCYRITMLCVNTGVVSAVMEQLY